LSPIAIPTLWRRVFVQIGKVRACLTTRGLRVTGGPSPGAPRNGPDTPIGELIVINGNALTFIGFYESRRAAEQYERTAINNMKRLGGQLARRGGVIVLWTRPPRAQLRNITEACAVS
jgi:uncharacterized protein YjeT (DUF2065 family)